MKALSETTVLALHALHLMMRKRAPVSLQEMVRSCDFPLPRLRHIIARLGRDGIVQSVPGRGFVLKRAPGEISIQDLVQALEPRQVPEAPCGGDYDACDRRASCFLSPLCRTAEENCRQTLRRFTLGDLMGTPADLPDCMETKPATACAEAREPWTP